MKAFRLFLILMILGIISYSGIAGFNHGWNLFPIFLGDILSMTWPGQFNFDFMCYLMLSGLWLAWRHHFTPTGLLLGLVGVIGGIMFLAPYLLITSYKVNGDLKEICLGKIRSNN